MKIGVIGAGAVGSACLLSSILRDVARETVVVNRERKRTKAVVTDLQYGAALSSVVQIRDGDYSDLTGAALVPRMASRSRCRACSGRQVSCKFWSLRCPTTNGKRY